MTDLIMWGVFAIGLGLFGLALTVLFVVLLTRLYP